MTTELPPQRLLLVVLISGRRLSVTVVAIDPQRGEEPKRHKELPLRWSELDHEGRVAALRRALDAACQPLGLVPHSLFIACTDPSLSATPVSGWAAIGEDIVITEHERDYALARARAHATADDREVLDILPTHWTVRTPDSQVDCDDPVGQYGSHVTCHALRITARRGLWDEYRRVVEGLGLHLEGLIPQPVALYRGVASRLPKTNTQLIIDIGARHTTLLVRRRGRLAHLETHAFGGDTVSERIAAALGVDIQYAEDLKHRLDIGSARPPEGEGQLTIFGAWPQQQLAVAARVAADCIGAFFRERARHLRDERDLLSQRGQIHLFGRGAALGGLAPFLADMFRLEAVLGSGGRNPDPGAELDGLLVAGVIRCATDRRIAHLEAESRTLRGLARRCLAWLAEPLR